MDMSASSRNTMLGQTVGRDDHAPETVPDLSQIIDVETLWPNPLDCPDWPHEVNNGYSNRRYEGARGKAGAEQRLYQLSYHINRGAKVHAPSAAERETGVATVFKRGGSAYGLLGIPNLAPLGRTVENLADQIADATHVRGYLRKLAALEVKAADDEKRRKLSDARQRLDAYNTAVLNGLAELADLAEAEARHKQRIEDEKAFHRCVNTRRSLQMGHWEAAQAAATLGVDSPECPTFDEAAEA